MEYRVLKYFLAVAREENITRAADILHISQPALSRQLMSLEEELGVQLLVRGKRSVTLTDAGMLLRRRAQEIVNLTEKTAEEFGAGGENLAGKIAIGSGEAETMRFVAQCMREFGDGHPEVTFEIYSNDADFVRERLEKGLLDIGVLIEPVDLSRYEYIRLPQKERWGALLPSDCPAARKEGISPHDLAGMKVFMPQRAVAQGVAEWFGEEFSALDVNTTYNLLYNAAMLVESGMGAALTIEGAASLYGNTKMVFRPFTPEHAVTSVLVWKKYQPYSAAVSAFLEHIRMRLDYDGR